LSIQKQIEELERVLKFLADDDSIQNRVTLVAAKEVEAEYKDRIFKDGKDSKGKSIGRYDTKPMYVSPKQLKGLPKGKFNRKGKTGQSKFKNGKKHRSTYLSGGYKELRDKTGRQSKRVDLNLTGASQQTIQVGKKGEGIVLGFTDAKRQVILEGNERRFGGNIFSLSKGEIDVFEIASFREMQFIIRQILRG
jgi:hypothetical protein